VVLPGLHFLGPDDPRLDRFCRCLAASGLLVIAPFIDAFVRLRLDASMYADAEAALALGRRRAEALGLGDPAVFSISFGSALALHVAAEADASSLVVFGGFSDFVRTVRFAITGRTEHEGRALELERDPLNAPVVFLNVLPFLALSGDREALARAWLDMVYRTWGKMELKRPGARDPIAHAIAETLPAELRLPFLRGCTLEDGALEWLEEGLDKGTQALSFLSPGANAARARCPVTLVHGRGDDVIPFTESVELSRALPAGSLRGLHLTGAFGHTGAASLDVREALREARTMLAMVTGLASAPMRRRPG
jgi:pimeloyl-ACP methyl ester carboxylesterase